MAWTAPRTYTTGETITKAILDTHVRDNFLECGPAKVTTKGDLLAANAANSLTRVAVGTDHHLLMAFSSCNAGVAWASGTTTTCVIFRNTNATAIFMVDSTASTAARYRIRKDGATVWDMYQPSSSSQLRFQYEASDKVTIDDDGHFLINATAADSTAAASATLHIGGANSACHLFTIASSAVAHGITDTADTSTIFTIRRFDSAGGVLMSSFEGTGITAFDFRAHAGGFETAKSQAADGTIRLTALEKSGTGTCAMRANANSVVIRVSASSGGFNTRFIFDSDGDYHADASNNASAFDIYDDAQMVRALELERNPAGIIRSEFDSWLAYNRVDLQAAKIATFNDGPDEDGSVFVNYTGLARLHSGAIWQNYTRTRHIEDQLADMTGSLVRLKMLMSGSPTGTD